MTEPTVIDQLRTQAIPILQKNGVVRAGVFGSAARGELNATSDIDLLVEFDPEFKKSLSLFGFFRIEEELEQIFHRSVEMVQYDLLQPDLKPLILKQEVRLYEILEICDNYFSLTSITSSNK